MSCQLTAWFWMELKFASPYDEQSFSISSFYSLMFPYLIASGIVIYLWNFGYFDLSFRWLTGFVQESSLDIISNICYATISSTWPV